MKPSTFNFLMLAFIAGIFYIMPAGARLGALMGFLTGCAFCVVVFCGPWRGR